MISDFSLMRLSDSFVSFNLTRIYLVLLRFMRTRIASRIGNGARLMGLNPFGYWSDRVNTESDASLTGDQPQLEKRSLS